MPGVVMKNNMNQQDDAKSITQFLSQIFRKVVRLVIGTVSLPALYDILKTIYVEEAKKKLARDGGKPTKSAIALMTGIFDGDAELISVEQLAKFKNQKELVGEVAMLILSPGRALDEYRDVHDHSLVGGGVVGKALARELLPPWWNYCAWEEAKR